MSIIKVGNKDCKLVGYKCIECLKEDLYYITVLEDTDTHYTRCYKCIFKDTQLIEYFKTKTAYVGE